MTDDEDELDPIAARQVVRGGLLACLGFAVCTGWTVVAAPGETSRPSPAPIAAPTSVAAAAPVAVEEPQKVALAVVQRTAEVSPARRLPGLLGLQLGFFRSRDLMGTIALDEVMRGTPAVKLVNLWATWCAPCVRENQRFLTLSQGWRREVRFVPIHVGAVGDPAKYRALVDQMPAAAVSPLVDASGDAVQSLLRADGLLSSGEGIPITLLLDCRNDLRWMHVGELVDVEALNAALVGLRAELGSARCASPEPVRPPGCGDGTCDAVGEHCSNCPDDCRCTTIGTVCRTAPDRPEPHCAYPDSAFEED